MWNLNNSMTQFSAGLRNLTPLWRSNCIYHFCSKTKLRSFAVTFKNLIYSFFILTMQRKIVQKQTR